MGFILTIGELEHYVDEDGDKRTTVKEVCHDNAPADGSPTDCTNKRWPSYIGWGEFCEYIGVEDDFFIPEHPGYIKITKKFQAEVHRLYDKYHGKNEDHNGRLAWLKYWTDWAIENCSNPVLHNT